MHLVRSLKLFLLCLLGSLLLNAWSMLPASARNLAEATQTDAAPVTIPALREWTPATGTYTFSANTRIVIDRAALNGTATVFANDLLDLTGLIIPVVQGVTPVAGDIVLALSATDSAIGTEGYLMTVASTLTIRARADAGAFYGTRTILQLLKQGFAIKRGTARDWPSFPERSMMVDNGRKYFTPTWLKNHIRELAYLKYNYFHFHLSDDQGFHLESNTVTPTEPIITKAELADIIAFATQYHITIVPEIDMPGHMAAILPTNLRLTYPDDHSAPAAGYLNIASNAGYTFAEQLINEYSPLFPGPYWHVGGDEFIVDWNRLTNLRTYARARFNNPTANALDGFIYFINHINQFVKAKGKHLRMWSDPLDGGATQHFDQDIVLELWDTSVDPNDAISRGYTIMNATFYPTYYVQGWENGGRPQYSPVALYEQWTPQNFFEEQFPPYASVVAPWRQVLSPPSPKLLGGKLQIWSDDPNAQTETQVATGIYEKLRAMAQNNWGSPKLVADFASFAPMIQTIGSAPGYAEPVLQPYDFSGEIVNPNATIPPGYYGNLIGDGTFFWQTGNCAIDVQTNGFVFSLNSGDGNPLNYSGVIAGGGSVVLRAGPAGYECCQFTPIVLSGDRPNSYTGMTTSLQGVVQLAKPDGVTAIPGDFVMVNQGPNDELNWAANNQIADSANLTIQSTGGKLTLAGHQETIHDLDMVDGATIDTGTGGELTVTHFWYNNIGMPAGTYTASNLPYLTGTGQLVVLESSASHQVFKVMPLGDSITYIGSSYRGLLYTQLRQAGYNVDFVGTLADPAEGGDDPDHEGHNGAPIGPGEPYEWDGNDPRYYSDRNDLYHLAPTFMAQNPDVILLLIGINDYTNYFTAQGTPASYDANRRSPAKLSALLDQILALKPDVKILVASLLPISQGRNLDVAPFNARIPAIVAQKVAAGKQVYFVNMNAEVGIDPEDQSQLYDGLHPTLEGSRKIANVWFKHLAPILSSQPQIFADGFETGNLNRWSAQVADNGDLAASPSAALTDSYGMNAVLDDNATLYVTDDRPYGEAGYGVRFRFDPNAIHMNNGDLHTLFYGYAGTATQVLRLDLRYATGKYQLRAALRDDGATWKNSAWFTISDALHLLQLDWQAATMAGANNGTLAFYIDDVLKSSLTGVDNDTRRIDRVRLGAVLGIDTGTRGSYFFDDFASYPLSAVSLDVKALAEATDATLEEVTTEEVVAEQVESTPYGLFLPLVTR